MIRDALDPVIKIPDIIDETLKRESEKVDAAEKFELTGVLGEVVPLRLTTSILSLHTKDGLIELKNNKSVEYWKRCKRISDNVVIKGSNPHDKDGLMQIQSAEPAGRMDLKKACTAEDLQQLTVLSARLDPHFLDALVKTSMSTKDYPEAENGEGTHVAATYEELKAAYIVLKNKYPPEIRNLLEHYFKRIPKAVSDEKDRIRRQMLLLVNYCHGVGDDLLKKHPSEIRASLDERFPGQKRIKDVLSIKRAAFIQDPLHRAPKILLHASSKYDLIRLVETFFELSDIPYDEYSVCGSTDNAGLQGSAPVYSNACLGPFAEKLVNKGIGGFIIKDIDQAGSNEGVMPLASMTEGDYLNELVGHSVSLQSEYIVFTAHDLDKIPFDISQLTILEPSDYSDEEMLAHLECILKRICSDHCMPHDYFELTDEVKREIALHYARKNSITDIEGILEEVCQNAMMANHGAERILVMSRDLNKYYSLLNEKKHLDEDYLETVEDVRKKCMISLEQVPPCLRDRVTQLLEEHERQRDEDKKKVLESKIIALGNIRIGNDQKYDFLGIQRELASVYGMSEAKEVFQDDLYAVENGSNKRLKPKILVGPPGVGKTSICDALGRGMGVPVIKIPFNQISDPREIMGYPAAHTNGGAGLLGRISRKGVSSLRCIVILDEFDKPAYAGAYGPFYNLFDQQMAWDDWYETFYDTSGIMFVCTANDISEIPYSLRDRCEILKISPYTCKERAEIVRQVLIPRLTLELGINGKITISESVMNGFVKDYSSSGGIRALEMNMECVLKRLSRKGGRILITQKAIRDCLGEPIGRNRRRNDANMPGVATALAVNAQGGNTFSIVTYPNPYGKEGLITGMAEGSMAESIKYALATASRLLGRKIEPSIHVGVGAGGIRKDGPSGGIALLMSILSYDLGIALGNVAFTGELSPTGEVCPVGEVLSKVIAAEMAGVEKVYLPYANHQEIKFKHELDSFDVKLVPVSTVYDLVGTFFPSVKFLDLANGNEPPRMK